MVIKRKLVKTETPANERGFLGPDHTARAVVRGNFSQTDPFILLMDDTLDKRDDSTVGGAHPHAGFETVTLLLDGEIGDAAHQMKPGDFQIMTAGSGIVHAETIDKAAKMRLLQLWLNLPQKNRWATPRVQDLPREHAASLNKEGVQVTLYSGSLAGLTSPVQNYTPLLVAAIRLEAGVTTIQEIPANFNTFMYVLEGSVKLGEAEKQLHQDQIGWLDLWDDETQSELQLTAGERGVYLVLYAGKPHRENIVSHGPFIADTSEDIMRLYQEYRQGKLQHIAYVPEEQRILL